MLNGSDLVECVAGMIREAREENDAEEALKRAQAAVHAAEAIEVLKACDAIQFGEAWESPGYSE